MRKVISILIVALLLAGCGKQSKNALPENKSERTVHTIVVEEREVTGEMVLSGDIVADERCVSRIVVPISGKVQALSVETGDDVSRGQRLCTVMSSEAADHQRELQAAESEMRLAQRELAVKESLYADGMASEREVAEARERLSVAEAVLRQQQSISQILSSVGGDFFDERSGKAERQSPTSVLSSPISGTVISRQVTTGQFVSAGEEAFVVADLSRVWAVADVYEADISRVSNGATVTVETMAWPGETFTGRIDKVYGALDAESKTMKVRINLANPDRRLRPGMFATVRVSQTNSETKHLPCIPPQAIVFENGHHYVILADSLGYHRQEVKLAIETDTLLYISEGLQSGQRVVSQQALLLFTELGQ